MPSYGDYVEFSSNDSICPAGFSVPTEGEFAAPTFPFLSIIILLLRSTQASAPKSILWLSLKALLALGVDIELTPSVSFEFGQENNNTA
jgi:hypothetical protein